MVKLAANTQLPMMGGRVVRTLRLGVLATPAPNHFNAVTGEGNTGEGCSVAIKYAFGDIAQGKLIAPCDRRGGPHQKAAQFSLRLFGDDAP